MAIFRLGCVFLTEYRNLLTGREFLAFELGVLIYDKDNKARKPRKPMTIVKGFDIEKCKRIRILEHLPALPSEVIVQVEVKDTTSNTVGLVSEIVILADKIRWTVPNDQVTRSRQRFCEWAALYEALEAVSK